MFDVLCLMFLQEGLMRLLIGGPNRKSKSLTICCFLVVNLIVVIASLTLYYAQQENNLYQELQIQRVFTQEELIKAVQSRYKYDKGSQKRVLSLLSHPGMMEMYDKYGIEKIQEGSPVNSQQMYSALMTSIIYYGILMIVAVWFAQVSESRKWMVVLMMTCFIQEINYYQGTLQDKHDLFDYLSNTIPIFQRVNLIKHMNVIFISLIKSGYNLFWIDQDTYGLLLLSHITERHLLITNEVIKEQMRLDSYNKQNPKNNCEYTMVNLIEVSQKIMKTQKVLKTSFKALIGQQEDNRPEVIQQPLPEQSHWFVRLVKRIVMFLFRMYAIGFAIQFVLQLLQNIFNYFGYR